MQPLIQTLGTRLPVGVAQCKAENEVRVAKRASGRAHQWSLKVCTRVTPGNYLTETRDHGYQGGLEGCWVIHYIYFISKDYSDLNLKASGDGLMVPLNRLDCNRLWREEAKRLIFILVISSQKTIFLVYYWFFTSLQTPSKTKTKPKQNIKHNLLHKQDGFSRLSCS